MKINERAKAPTPKIFKKLRNIGLIMAAVGGTILTAPVSLPALVSSIGGYIAVAGGVLSSVSQITVEDKTVKEEKNEEQ
ncbi:hypothetical protein CAP47_02050 [Psychroflexus sp. S27]|uniref:hypothetical protein n=1 Tax=Psychroflexus sp. S27 TaxID=1982757 RepID=UPI000C2B48C0|nr:hypothetical protein [Psychroflexus sp. S27]PJX26917.1 hypothetical protein CAP47_02050 [Psychroflexus sp. S27]